MSAKLRPRFEERVNAKRPEGMPDRVILIGFVTSSVSLTSSLNCDLREINKKRRVLNLILAVKSSFLASFQDAVTKAIPFRGFPLRCNPRLRSAIASRSR